MSVVKYGNGDYHRIGYNTSTYRKVAIGTKQIQTLLYKVSESAYSTSGGEVSWNLSGTETSREMTTTTVNGITNNVSYQYSNLKYYSIYSTKYAKSSSVSVAFCDTTGRLGEMYNQLRVTNWGTSVSAATSSTSGYNLFQVHPVSGNFEVHPTLTGTGAVYGNSFTANAISPMSLKIGPLWYTASYTANAVQAGVSAIIVTQSFTMNSHVISVSSGFAVSATVIPNPITAGNYATSWDAKYTRYAVTCSKYTSTYGEPEQYYLSSRSYLSSVVPTATLVDGKTISYSYD